MDEIHDLNKMNLAMWWRVKVNEAITEMTSTGAITEVEAVISLSEVSQEMLQEFLAERQQDIISKLQDVLAELGDEEE